MTVPRPEELAALCRLTDAAFAAARARMGALRRREADLHGRIEALHAARSTTDEAAGAELDPASRAGADLLWQQWVEARRQALTAELARTRALIEDARSDLSRGFGRDQAARALHARANREHALPPRASREHARHLMRRHDNGS